MYFVCHFVHSVIIAIKCFIFGNFFIKVYLVVSNFGNLVHMCINSYERVHINDWQFYYLQNSAKW